MNYVNFRDVIDRVSSYDSGRLQKVILPIHPEYTGSKTTNKTREFPNMRTYPIYKVSQKIYEAGLYLYPGQLLIKDFIVGFFKNYF